MSYHVTENMVVCVWKKSLKKSNLTTLRNINVY